MNEPTLQTRVGEAMARSTRDLVIFDKDADEWHRHPWPEVHALATGIASHVMERTNGTAPTVGIVGEPTVELVAGLPAAWLAGGTFTIAPGPVRGADPALWARATLDRFAAAGVTNILSHGSALASLQRAGCAVAIDDVKGLGEHPRSSYRPPTPLFHCEDTALLQSTAGSTGDPRTIAISGRALLANTAGLANRFAATNTDIACSWLPLYHDMGLMFLVASMIRDMEMWLAPTSAFASAPFRWLDWISASRATLTAAPNFAYNLIGAYSSRVQDVDLSTVRVALNGGEAVDCHGFGRFVREMHRFGLPPGAATAAYGLAESSCAVTAPAVGTGLRYDEVRVTDGSGSRTVQHALLGTPIDGMQVRIRPMDALTIDFPEREVGQVEIRGSSMMSGYLGSGAVRADEWFPTGDLGYLAGTELVVCGRVTEVIHLAGRNIFPTDVERAAASVDGIRAGAVVATSVRVSGRDGLAIVAEYRGKQPSGAKQQVVERVSAECGVIAATVELVEPGHLPRTTSGKLRRTEVGRRLDREVLARRHEHGVVATAALGGQR